MTATRPSAAAADGAVVFLAEDDTGLRSLLEVAMRRLGHDVVACGDGRQLLERLQQYAVDHDEQPALVISDQRMPGLTGMEIVEVVRGWGWVVPFVLITAFPDADLLDRAVRSGINTVVSKPFSIPHLMATVERCVAHPRYVSCASCGDPVTDRGTGTNQDSVVAFCIECEPTGRHRANRDFDDAYIDHGGG